MTQLTALQVADYWIAAGGSKSKAVVAVAVSLGESSYDTAALSSAGAIGLWQIMPFNAAPHGYTVADLYNPSDNARIAVEMSGNGTNWAAWDSCYADINASGRLSYLPWPQPGSADYNNLGPVSVELGHDKLGGAVPPPGASVAGAVEQAQASLDAMIGKLFPAMEKILIADRMAAMRLFTK